MIGRNGVWAVAGLMALAIGLASGAEAASITCPNPTYTYGNKNQHTSNTYTVSPAIDCVWGPAGSSNLGSTTDDFVSGLGFNDAAYGNTGATFGLSWTFVKSTGGVTSAQLASVSGLTFTNFTNDFANWVIDPAALNLAYGTSFNTFALGVKDGSDPKWSVFLLDSNHLSGTVSMTGGSFSHFVVYGANVIRDTPEPSVLLLFGAAAAATSMRKRRRSRVL
jgi:hypothetical protein